MRTCFENRFALGFVAVAVISSGCAGSTTAAKKPVDLSPASLYPLRPAAAWSYDVDSGDGDSVLAVARVTRSEGDLVEVATGSEGAIGYIVHDDGITRASNGSYLLKAPIAAGASWSSGQDTTAHVLALGVSLITAAGPFSDCVSVQEDNTGTGQRVTTTYCPGVGPAQVVSEMEVRGQQLRVIAKLRGYTLE